MLFWVISQVRNMIQCIYKYITYVDKATAIGMHSYLVYFFFLLSKILLFMIIHPGYYYLNYENTQIRSDKKKTIFVKKIKTHKRS